MRPVRSGDDGLAGSTSDDDGIRKKYTIVGVSSVKKPSRPQMMRTNSGGHEPTTHIPPLNLEPLQEQMSTLSHYGSSSHGKPPARPSSLSVVGPPPTDRELWAQQQQQPQPYGGIQSNSNSASRRPSATFYNPQQMIGGSSQPTNHGGHSPLPSSRRPSSASAASNTSGGGSVGSSGNIAQQFGGGSGRNPGSSSCSGVVNSNTLAAGGTSNRSFGTKVSGGISEDWFDGEVELDQEQLDAQELQREVLRAVMETAASRKAARGEVDARFFVFGQCQKLNRPKPLRRYLRCDPSLATVRAIEQGYAAAEGQTPLHVAARFGNIETMKILLEDPTPTVPSTTPSTAAITATPSTSSSNTTGTAIAPPVLGLITPNKEKKPRISLWIRDIYGKTPLHVAAENGQKEMCEYLRQLMREEKGIDPIGVYAPTDLSGTWCRNIVLT